MLSSERIRFWVDDADSPTENDKPKEIKNTETQNYYLLLIPYSLHLMTTFFSIPTLDFSGEIHKLTISTGPVVMDHARNKILLHKSSTTLKWQFIWGRYDDSLTFRENALERAREVVGDNMVTLIDTEHPIILLDMIDRWWYEEQILLVHYSATIADEDDTWEAQWFSLDEIVMLDAKNETSSENIKIVSEHFLK